MPRIFPRASNGTLGSKCVCHGSKGAVWERQHSGGGFLSLGLYRALAEDRVQWER